jgi:hypothetical protein
LPHSGMIEGLRCFRTWFGAENAQRPTPNIERRIQSSAE